MFRCHLDIIFILKYITKFSLIRIVITAIPNCMDKHVGLF